MPTEKLLRTAANTAITIALLSMASCLYWGYQFGCGKVKGVAATPDEMRRLRDVVPAAAQDIHYWMAYGLSGYRYYNCRVSQEHFESHAKKMAWGLKPIEKEIEIRNPFYPSSPARIREGLWYERRQQNNGGVLVAYDASAGYLYYQASSR